MSNHREQQQQQQQQQRHLQMTAEEVRVLMRETVRETFLMMGMKVDDPIEVQKDLLHLREWRITMEKVRSKSMMTAVGMAAAGVVAAFWIGIKDVFGVK